MNKNLHARAATAADIGEIDRLMRQQAEHHNYAYTGTPEKLASALENNLMTAFLVYDDQIPDRAVCCATYRTIWMPEGSSAYLEDICTDKNYRGGGIGKFAIEEVRRRAVADGSFAITGAVAKDNHPTMQFWLKNNYSPLPKRGFDLTNLFNDAGAVKNQTAYHCERITGPNKNLPSFLQPAAADPTACVEEIKDESGETAAIVIANAKFSPTSCSSSLTVEPAIFLKPLDDSQKKDVLRAGISAALDFAKAKGYSDHLFAMTASDCEASNDFMLEVGQGERLDNPPDPNSLLVCMGLTIAPPPQP